MLKLILTTGLCLSASQSIAATQIQTADFTQEAEIMRIDPGKTLDLIKRIKTAKDGVAS